MGWDSGCAGFLGEGVGTGWAGLSPSHVPSQTSLLSSILLTCHLGSHPHTTPLPSLFVPHLSAGPVYLPHQHALPARHLKPCPCPSSMWPFTHFSPTPHAFLPFSRPSLPPALPLSYACHTHTPYTFWLPCLASLLCLVHFIMPPCPTHMSPTHTLPCARADIACILYRHISLLLSFAHCLCPPGARCARALWDFAFA